MTAEKYPRRACCPDWAADVLMCELHFTPASWTNQHVHTVLCGGYTVVIALRYCPVGYQAAAVSDIPGKTPHIIRPTHLSGGLCHTRRQISRQDIELLAEIETRSATAHSVLATAS